MFRLEAGMTAETIGIGIEGFLRNKNLVVEGMKAPEGYLVQAKEEESWKKFAGMDQATQVQIFQSTLDSITVNVGAGKWMDKAATAGVGAVVFAPLLATAAFGAYKQKKLPGEIFDFIKHFILTGGKTATITMNASVGANKAGKEACPNCQAMNELGTKFCSSCGTALGKNCPNCGESINNDTAFCPHCGTNVAQAEEKHCANCDVVIEESTKFCPECGTPA